MIDTIRPPLYASLLRSRSRSRSRSRRQRQLSASATSDSVSYQRSATASRVPCNFWRSSGRAGIDLVPTMHRRLTFALRTMSTRATPAAHLPGAAVPATRQAAGAPSARSQPPPVTPARPRRWGDAGTPAAKPRRTRRPALREVFDPDPDPDPGDSVGDQEQRRQSADSDSGQRQQPASATSVSNQRHPFPDAQRSPILPSGVLSMVASEWLRRNG